MCLTTRWFGTGVTSGCRRATKRSQNAPPKAYGATGWVARVPSVISPSPIFFRGGGGCTQATHRLVQVWSQLVMSKSRVATIKAMSLPRLELLAAVVNGRLLMFVVDTLPIKMHPVLYVGQIVWPVTLHWIRGQRSWAPTRGLTCDNMSSSGLW